MKGVIAEESGGIPILYKSVSPCLDISSGSFTSGRGPADVGVAELRYQLSCAIYVIFRTVVYFLHPVLFISFYYHPVFLVGVSDINKEHLLTKQFLQLVSERDTYS